MSKTLDFDFWQRGVRINYKSRKIIQERHALRGNETKKIGLDYLHAYISVLQINCYEKKDSLDSNVIKI